MLSLASVSASRNTFPALDSSSSHPSVLALTLCLIGARSSRSFLLLCSIGPLSLSGQCIALSREGFA